ncbi:hypothetical protein E2P86_09055 [Sphingobacterium psychroaquaticum]|uniref:hypothetical protein n=1 Tax=Sphingobacterium psychroaquaticum TaxID=561061 RepID=UPI00106DBB83|nr:hypothetical protein [Sphingobacterium psychroaquaticum]QBQ41296.1 hypothetical protein E2P86_09055 [Sphingobacterium psychroaquaticum]
MQQLIKSLTEEKRLDELAAKYTLLIDESQKAHGALFFLEVKGRNYKIMVPAPHHEALLAKGAPKLHALLNHREAMLLK